MGGKEYYDCLYNNCNIMVDIAYYLLSWMMRPSNHFPMIPAC